MKIRSVERFIAPLAFPSLVLALALAPLVMGGVPDQHRDAYTVAIVAVFMAAVFRWALSYEIRELERRWGERWTGVAATGASFDAVAGAIQVGFRRLEGKMEMDNAAVRDAIDRIDKLEQRVETLEQMPIIKAGRRGG